MKWKRRARDCRVSDVHDLHVWSIGSENHALSAHVKISDMQTSESDAILREINEKLGLAFGIRHTRFSWNTWYAKRRMRA